MFHLQDNTPFLQIHSKLNLDLFYTNLIWKFQDDKLRWTLWNNSYWKFKFHPRVGQNWKIWWKDSRSGNGKRCMSLLPNLHICYFCYQGNFSTQPVLSINISIIVNFIWNLFSYASMTWYLNNLLANHLLCLQETDCS